MVCFSVYVEELTAKDTTMTVGSVIIKPAPPASAPSLVTFKKRIKSVFCCLQAIATFFIFSNCLLLCILCTVIICTVLATSRCKHFLY